MKKRIFTIFLVILLTITNMSVCYADGVDTLTNIGIDNYGGTIDWTPQGQESTTIGEIQNFWEDATGIIRTVMSILTWPLTMGQQFLIYITAQIVPMMDTVVFNKGIWGNITRLTFFDDPSSTGFGNTIAGKMQGAVSEIYQIFRYVALLGFIVVIACIAVKMIMSSIGKQKQQYKEQLKNWVIGLVLLVIGHWIMIYLIYFSAYLVELISLLMKSLSGWSWETGYQAGTLYGQFADCITNTAVSFSGIARIINVIVNILVIIVFIAMNMKIFKVYLERVIVVAVLIMLFPLVTLLYAFEKAGLRRGSTFSTWLNTFVSQVFIQPIHALSLMLVIIVLEALQGINIGIMYPSIFALPIIGPILILTAINFVFKIEEVIKRVFAVSGASLAQPMKPMQEVGKLAKGAINKGIHGYNAGLEMALATDKKAKFKDIATTALGKWGKKNGLDLDRLGLIESKDIGSKIKAAVKDGKIKQEHIPEIISKFKASGDMYERLAKFGINGELEFASLAKNGDLRAMLAVMDLNESGSADKYLKIAKDGNGNFTKSGLDKAQDLFDKSRIPEDQRKRDIRNMANGVITEEGKSALQVNLELENSKRGNAIYGAFGKTFDEFSNDELQAASYCVEKDINIADVIMKNSDGSYGGIDVTKVNPMKSDAREVIARHAGQYGVKNTVSERRAARSYAMAEPEYFAQRVESAGLNMNELELWMQGKNNNIDEAKLQELFSLLPNKKKIVQNAEVRTPEVRTPVIYKTDDIGGHVYNVEAGASIDDIVDDIMNLKEENNSAMVSYEGDFIQVCDYNSREELLNFLGNRKMNAEVRTPVIHKTDDIGGNVYNVEAGASIDDIVDDIMEIKEENDSALIGYGADYIQVSDYDSREEFLDLVSQGYLEQFMTAPEGNFAQYNTDDIVTYVDKKDSNFFVDKFRMPADEVMRSLKTNNQAQKNAILKKLQNELKIAQK